MNFDRKHLPQKPPKLVVFRWDAWTWPTECWPSVGVPTAAASLGDDLKQLVEVRKKRVSLRLWDSKDLKRVKTRFVSRLCWLISHWTHTFLSMSPFQGFDWNPKWIPSPYSPEGPTHFLMQGGEPALVFMVHSCQGPRNVCQMLAWQKIWVKL